MIFLISLNLLLGIIFLFTGIKFSKILIDKNIKILFGCLLFALCIPSIIVIVYNSISTPPIWYIKFRSNSICNAISYSAASLWCLFIGFITRKKSTSKVRWPLFNKFFYLIGILLVLASLIDQLFPVYYFYKLHDEWANNVCIQTSSVTCAPASVATVLKYFNIDRTESEIAHSVNTTIFGTNIWDTIKYLRDNHLNVECTYNKDINNIHLPAIIDVYIYNIKHAIVIFEKERDIFLIGDPLKGMEKLSYDEFYNIYKFDGLAIQINK